MNEKTFFFSTSIRPIENHSLRKKNRFFFVCYAADVIPFYLSESISHSIDLNSGQHFISILTSILNAKLNMFINETIDLNLKKKNVSPKEGCWVFFIYNMRVMLFIPFDRAV
jgi:hypothetical protein